MHKKRRLASGKNIFKKASVSEHCMFTRLMPGMPACILHIWCNNKTNLSYFQSLHASWGAHLLKNQSRLNRLKWYHTDNHYPPPSKPKTTPKGKKQWENSLHIFTWTLRVDCSSLNPAEGDSFFSSRHCMEWHACQLPRI